MAYDFDRVINRKNTLSSKWDNVGVRVGNPNALPMWVADMDFACPQPVLDAVQKRAALGIYGYAFLPQEFRTVTERWMQLRHKWDISGAQVLHASGTMPVLHAAVQAFTLPGEQVIIQRPVYYPFTHAVEEQGRQVSDNALVENNGRWEIDFEDLQRRAENPKAKLMFLCSPHNPVSRVFTREELTKIAEICLQNKVLLVSDEIHSDFVFSGYSHIPVASLSKAIAKNTITTISPSKTFNTAGLNIASAIVFDEDIAARLQRVQTNNRANPLSAFGLDAYLAAYGQGEEYVNRLVAYLEESVAYLDGFLKENTPKIKLTKPEGTYLMWLDCREMGLNKQELDDFFTQKSAVALDMGWWFGTNGTGFMRMNIACPRSILMQGLNQIKDAYGALGL